MEAENGLIFIDELKMIIIITQLCTLNKYVIYGIFEYPYMYGTVGMHGLKILKRVEIL